MMDADAWVLGFEHHIVGENATHLGIGNEVQPVQAHLLIMAKLAGKVVRYRHFGNAFKVSNQGTQAL